MAAAKPVNSGKSRQKAKTEEVKDTPYDIIKGSNYQTKAAVTVRPDAKTGTFSGGKFVSPSNK